MNYELKTHNLFITTNDLKDLIDFKRGILPEDDEYKVRPREVKEEKDEQ